MLKHFIWIVLIFTTSPIYSQTDINKINQTRAKTSDLIFQYLQESIRKSLQPPIIIIDNPKWHGGVDIDDRSSPDFFKSMPFKNSGRNEQAPSKNNDMKFMAGWGGGLFGGFIGVIIGDKLDDCTISDTTGFCYGTFFGFLIGYNLGNATGVNIVGKISRENGSYKATLGGSVLAQLLVAAVIVTREVSPPIALLIGAVASPLGATIGYNRSRKFESIDRQGTALINLNRGKIEIATPMIYFHHLQSTNRHVQMIDILHVAL